MSTMDISTTEHLIWDFLLQKIFCILNSKAAGRYGGRGEAILRHSNPVVPGTVDA